MRIALYFQNVVKPAMCACCGGRAEAAVKALGAAATLKRVDRKEGSARWFPYCNACVRHTKLGRPMDFATGVLAVITLGLYFVYYLVRRARAKSALSRRCACVGPAVSVLDAGESFYDIELRGRAFAREFALANRRTTLQHDATAVPPRRPPLPLPSPRAYPRVAAQAGPVVGPPSAPLSAVNRTVPLAERQSGPPVNQAAPPIPGLSTWLLERPPPSKPAWMERRPLPPPRVAVTTQFGGPRALPPRPALRTRTLSGTGPGAPAVLVAPRERFVGAGERVTVAGRAIASPFTYVLDSSTETADASTIVIGTPVGRAASATPLPYWPSYAGANPDQRAVYLDWMAGGRVDPDVPIGYVFIFFYGLERRVLIDGLDDAAVREEILRLRSVYAAPSFQRYSAELLVFLDVRVPERFQRVAKEEIDLRLGALMSESVNAILALTAWYHTHREPLPARHALVVARGMESAKRGVVVERAVAEVSDLFSIRYEAAFGRGILLEAAKLPVSVRYSPASASLPGDLEVSLPNVLGRASQFNEVVAVWNRCVDDLRKASSRKAGGKSLDADGWAALPPELRAQYDHPDQDRWDEAVAGFPVLGAFHLVQAGQLATLLRLGKTARVTAAQLKKIGRRAEEVGYAIEPDPRIHSGAVGWSSELLIWRGGAAMPDPKIHAGVFAMVTLGAAVGLADGQFTQDEHEVLGSFLTEVFDLNEDMRIRVEAMSQLVQRQPARIDAVAKKIAKSVTRDEKQKVAGLLVAIAAADGIVGEAENQVLRRLYLQLGLTELDLRRDLGQTDARLSRPRGTMPGLVLDYERIAALTAETRDVASSLGRVFDNDDDGEASSERDVGLAASPPAVELPRASDGIVKLAASLDTRYHAVLEDLLARDSWRLGEVRDITGRHGLMQEAVFVIINQWSDEALGDFLIEDQGDWKINRALARVQA